MVTPEADTIAGHNCGAALATAIVFDELEGALRDRGEPEFVSARRQLVRQLLPVQLVSRKGWALSDSSDQPRPERKKNSAGRGENKRSLTEPGWDRWLDRQIHQLYDPVLSETIPKEMFDLLMRFEEKPKEGDDGT